MCSEKVNTITSPTLLGEQTQASKKHFLDLKHLKHPVHKLSAPASSSPKVRVLDMLPFQEEVPSGTDRSLTCVQIIAVGSFTQPFQSYGGKKAITRKHRGKRHVSLLKHPILLLEHRCGAKSRCRWLSPEKGKQIKAPGKNRSPRHLPKPTAGPPTPQRHPPLAGPGMPSQAAHRTDPTSLPKPREEPAEGGAVPERDSGSPPPAAHRGPPCP